MMSQGSMTLPRDLLILRPWVSRTSECRRTWRGTETALGDTKGDTGSPRGDRGPLGASRKYQTPQKEGIRVLGDTEKPQGG